MRIWHLTCENVATTLDVSGQAELASAVHAGGGGGGDRGLHRDYLLQWLRHSRGRLRSKTYEGYDGVIRLYAAPALGGIPPSPPAPP